MTKEDVISFQHRVKKLLGEELNEAQTKISLVQPFIEALGYSTSNPFEIKAEYVADVGGNRSEKIDYAILHNGSPVMLIECKPKGSKLDTKCCSQLRRYFNTTPEAKIGVLTDGVRYQFFSDRKQPNIMDERPFMEVNFSAFNEELLPELQKLTKETLDIPSLLITAESLQDYQEVYKEFSQEISEPSEDFVRFFASRVHNGRVSAKILEYYTPIFMQVLENYFDEKINQRLEESKVAPKAIEVKERPDGIGIATTNTETWGLVIVRTLLHEVVDPCRIGMRDQRSYCPIILDNNNRKTICRFYNFTEWCEGDMNIGENAYVLVFSEPSGVKFPVQYVDDIYPLKEFLVKAVRQYL